MHSDINVMRIADDVFYPSGVCAWCCVDEEREFEVTGHGKYDVVFE